MLSHYKLSIPQMPGFTMKSWLRDTSKVIHRLAKAARRNSKSSVRSMDNLATMPYNPEDVAEIPEDPQAAPEEVDAETERKKYQGQDSMWQSTLILGESSDKPDKSPEVDAEKVSDATPDLGDAAASAHSDVPPVPAQDGHAEVIEIHDQWDPTWEDSQPLPDEPSEWQESEGEQQAEEGGEPGDDMTEGNETAEGGGGGEVGQVSDEVGDVGEVGEVPGEVPGGYASMQDAVAKMKYEGGFIWDQWNGRWWVGLPPDQFPPAKETPMEHLPEPAHTEPKEPAIKTPSKRPAAREPKAPKKAKKPKGDAEEACLETMNLPELVDYMHSVKHDWSLIPPKTPGYVADVVKYMSLLFKEWGVDGVKDFDYWLRLRDHKAWSDEGWAWYESMSSAPTEPEADGKPKQTAKGKAKGKAKAKAKTEKGKEEEEKEVSEYSQARNKFMNKPEISDFNRAKRQELWKQSEEFKQLIDKMGESEAKKRRFI